MSPLRLLDSHRSLQAMAQCSGGLLSAALKQPMHQTLDFAGVQPAA